MRLFVALIFMMIGISAFAVFRSPALADDLDPAKQLANVRLLAHLRDNKLWPGSWSGMSGPDTCEVDVVWSERAGLPVVQVRYTAAQNGVTWRDVKIELAATDRLSNQKSQFGLENTTKESIEKDVESEGAKTVTRLKWDRLHKEETIGAVSVEVAQGDKTNEFTCEKLTKLERECDPSSKSGCAKVPEPIDEPEVVAAPAPKDKTWVGYKKTEDTGIPIADLIEKTTFQMINAGGTHTKESDFTIVDTVSAKKQPKHSALDSDFRAFQIETCRRQKLKKCPVSLIRSSSTTFFEVGKIQYLCRHSVHNWLTMATKYNDVDLTSIYPPMMIKNKFGDVIYNTAYSKGIPSSVFLNPEPKLNIIFMSKENEADQSKMGRYFAISDIIIYKYRKFITDPVVLASSLDVADSDTIYTSGYPGETYALGGVGKGDAPGDTLVTSSGRLLEKTDVFATSSNFLGSGNSGGPVFNQSGKLVGMSCMGDPEQTTITPIDENFLKSAWKEYDFFLK